MTHRWSAIERIFHAALDRPVEARAAFLAEACGDDRELLREVQSLLDQSASTAFLEQPALQVAAGLVTAATLAPLTGHQIGVYSVGALLGRGGMGEVYRARDTRLGRDVAIKVLPRTLTSDPDRLARFEREARMLASLNHPHIGMLYGIEEGGGHRALVLELIEGETLADRLARGPVPIEQALTWARQIADALDAAHEKGIVHRDLKPANVKTASQETIKVLDFGLARTFSDGGDLEEPRSPTITHEGAGILGTAAYMSPEQARGQQVDRRTDVWAFGCVLYELLTGRPAFLRSTVSDTLAAVLNEQPDWAALPPALPPAVPTLLRRCLEKDVRRRRRDIADVRAELEDAMARRETAPASSAVARPAWRFSRIAVVSGGVAAAGALLVLAGVWMQGEPPAPPAMQLQRITDAVGVEEMPAVSRDGKELAYVARHQGVRQIWTRRLAGGPPFQITQDDVDHEHPRWTDSSSIVYFVPSRTEGEDGILYDIPVYGGPPRKLGPASTGADVSPDGQWLATFQKRGTSVALVILARDGSTSALTIPIATDPVESTPVLTPPRWSPDGTTIASYV